PDVQKFPGHITCDAASRAEIVVPLLEGGTLIGVLDVDSPVAGRFDEADARGLEALAALLVAGGAPRPARCPRGRRAIFSARTRGRSCGLQHLGTVSGLSSRVGRRTPAAGDRPSHHLVVPAAAGVDAPAGRARLPGRDPRPPGAARAAGADRAPHQ